MAPNSIRGLILRFAAASVILWPRLGAAADFGAQVSAGYLHSDNIEQTAVANSSGVVEADGKFQLGINTADLNLDFDSDFRFRTFTNSKYGSDFLPRVRAGAAYTVSENVLYFSAQEDLGQIALISGQGLQPADRQNVNVFTLGPDYFLGLSEQSRIHVSARYSFVNYQVSDQDDHRVRGEVSYNRDLTGALTFAAGVFATRTDFTRADSPSTDTKGFTVGITGETRRTQLRAILGLQELTDLGERTRGLYGDVEVSRLISRRSRLLLSAISRFGDSSDAFIFGQEFSASFDSAVGVQVRSRPIRIQGVGAAYAFTGARLTASFGGSWVTNKDLNALDADQTVRSIFVSSTYRFTDAFSFGINANRTRSKTPGFLLELEQNSSAGAVVKWHPLGKIEFSLRTEFFDRTQSIDNFTEMRYGLFVTVDFAERKASDLFSHHRPAGRVVRDRTIY